MCNYWRFWPLYLHRRKRVHASRGHVPFANAHHAFTSRSVALAASAHLILSISSLSYSCRNAHFIWSTLEVCIILAPAAACWHALAHGVLIASPHLLERERGRRTHGTDQTNNTRSANIHSDRQNKRTSPVATAKCWEYSALIAWSMCAFYAHHNRVTKALICKNMLNILVWWPCCRW